MLDRANEVDDSIEEQARLESAEEAAVRGRIGETVDNEGNRLIVGGTLTQGAPPMHETEASLVLSTTCSGYM